MIPITEHEFEAWKARLNDSIHELVFAVQHLSQDDIDDALTCLVTAQGTLEAVAEELSKKEVGK